MHTHQARHPKIFSVNEALISSLKAIILKVATVIKRLDGF